MNKYVQKSATVVAGFLFILLPFYYMYMKYGRRPAVAVDVDANNTRQDVVYIIKEK